MIERALRVTALLGACILVGCGGGGGSGEPEGLGGGGGPAAVTVQFNSYCTGPAVTVYETDPDGSSCTEVDTSGPVVPTVGGANAYSASTTGAPDCTAGTRVEITPGSNGDVSYDISTNAAYQSTPFFNVAVQFLALQRTAPSTCALPLWNGKTGPTDLRGVSSQVCDVDTCPTAYQTPTSGPQFITRDTAASSYVVEWCPGQNTSPIPLCTAPTFEPTSPCANVCWEDAVQSPAPCDSFADHVMCTVDPFGGTRPASYCLLTSDCTKYGGQSCGCCTSNSDCSNGQSCTNFLCQ